MVKVGDIIDGRMVTKVYMLVGEVAYDTEPVEELPEIVKVPEPEKPKRRIRKKKEQ